MNILNKFKNLKPDEKIIVGYLLGLLAILISSILGVNSIGNERNKKEIEGKTTEYIETGEIHAKSLQNSNGEIGKQELKLLSGVPGNEEYEYLSVLYDYEEVEKCISYSNTNEDLGQVCNFGTNLNIKTTKTINISDEAVAQSGLLPKELGKIESIDYIDLASMTKHEIEKRISDLNNLKILLEKLTFSENSSVYIATVEEIERCEEAIKNHEFKMIYTEQDVNLLAYAIHRELGSSWVPQEYRLMIGCVVMNRVNQGGINKNRENPSVKDILNEPGQFPYKVNLDYVNLNNIEDYCFEAAYDVLEGRFKIPSNVVYAATFKQGTGVYETYYDSVYNNTTYFCYGK